jgi:hypothetical protein
MFGTFHDYCHVIDQAMDNLEGLGSCHASLLVGEPIEPAEDCRNVVFSQQFLCEFP